MGPGGAETPPPLSEISARSEDEPILECRRGGRASVGTRQGAEWYRFDDGT